MYCIYILCGGLVYIPSLVADAWLHRSTHSYSITITKTWKTSVNHHSVYSSYTYVHWRRPAAVCVHSRMILYNYYKGMTYIKVVLYTFELIYFGVNRMFLFCQIRYQCVSYSAVMWSRVGRIGQLPSILNFNCYFIALLKVILGAFFIFHPYYYCYRHLCFLDFIWC